MINWIKKLFGIKSADEAKMELVEKENELLKNRIKVLEEELEWYESLGLPNHQLVDGGFDYYNHMRDVISQLREDKRALTIANARLHKELERTKAMEKLYLEEIVKMRKEIELLKLAKTPISFVEEDDEQFAEKQEQTVQKKQEQTIQGKVEQTEEIEENHEELSPLQEVRRKIRGLRINYKA